MPPQHGKRQTFLVTAVWMMLMAMPSMADKVATKGGGQDVDNGEQVFTELVAGTRPVLLFTKDHSLLVVGSSGATIATTKLEDTYVFKVASSSNNTSVLLKEMQKIKSAWAKLTGPYTAMFAVGESIVLVDGSGASVLDAKSGTINKMSLGKSDKLKLQANWLLSSSKTPNFFYITPTDKSLFVSVAFDTTNLAQATKIVSTPDRYLCNAGNNQILIQSIGCKTDSVSWTILAGYVDDTDFTLIQQGNSIIRFSKNAFDHPDGGPEPLKNIAANQFWRYAKPTAPPTAKHNDLFSTTGSSSLGIIIAVVCVVLLLFIIVGVAVYCIYFKKEQKPSSKGGLKMTSSTAKSLSKSTSKVPSKQSRRSGSRNMTKQNSVHQKATPKRSKISDVRSESAGTSNWNSFADVKSKDTNVKLQVPMAAGPDQEMLKMMKKKRPSKLTGVWPKKMGSARKVVKRGAASSSKRSIK